MPANAQNGENNAPKDCAGTQETAMYFRKIDSIHSLLPSLEGQEKINAVSRLTALYIRTSCVDRKIDSLTRLLPSITATADRFLFYCWLRRLYENTSRSDEQLAFMKDAVKFMHKHKYKEQESMFRRDVMVLSYNLGIQVWQQYVENIEADLNFWKDSELWEDYYFAIYIEAMGYIRHNKHQTALARAKAECATAKNRNFTFGEGLSLGIMGMAYKSLENYSEAAKCFREAVDVLQDEFVENGVIKLDISPLGATFFFDFLWFLAKSAPMAGDSETAIRALAEWKLYMTQLEQASRPVNAHTWFKLYSTGVRAYSGTGGIDEAEKWMASLDSIYNLTSRPVTVVSTYHDALIDLRVAQKRYGEALSYIDFLLQNREAIDIDGYLGLLKTQAVIADSTDNTALAAETYRTLCHLNDSINKKQTVERLDEMRTLYELDRHILEKKRIRNALIFVATVLILTLLGWIFHSRKMGQKNRGLIRQIKEQDRLTAELEQMTARYYEALLPAQQQNKQLDDKQNEQCTEYSAEYNDRHKENEQNLSQCEENQPDIKIDPAKHEHYYRLFVRLREYLLTDRNFANPNLDHDVLISNLSTNHTYLLKAVKTATGKTLQEYITLLRLEDAKRLLETSEYTIELIVDMCGFGSVRTFYRLFHNRYDITTTEYKRNKRNVRA